MSGGLQIVGELRPAGSRGGRAVFAVLFALAVLSSLFIGQKYAIGAEYRLSEAGAILGALVTSGAVDDLRIEVALDGDRPIATHVYASVAAAELRQRTNLGYWVPWDGNRDSLIDNGFSVQDDRIVYKILDEDIGVDNQGVSVIVGYKTASEFKFGVFGVIPDGSSR